MPSIEQCNEVVNHVLAKMLTPGAILTHAHNFNNGVNCKVDMEEADKLYTLYFRLVQIATHKNSDSALRALGRCYEMGWGTPINLTEALRCYRYTIGCSAEDAERVIQKIQGTWQENIEESIVTRPRSLVQRFLEIFKK